MSLQLPCKEIEYIQNKCGIRVVENLSHVMTSYLMLKITYCINKIVKGKEIDSTEKAYLR